MKIVYSPQRNDDIIEYDIQGEVIIATLKKGHEEMAEEGEVTFIVTEEHTDTFDFMDMPDGKLEESTSTLPVNPLLSAERIDGVLHVTLLKYHGANATQEELFPEEIEVV